MFTLGNLGVLVAAVTVARITQVIRLGPRSGSACSSAARADSSSGSRRRSTRSSIFVVAWLLFGFGGTIYNIDQVSLRQAITPHRMPGRMNASMRFMVWGTMPFGSLAGGVLGTAIGLRSTLLVAGIGGLFAVLWVSARAVWQLEKIPDAVPATTS